MKTNATFGITLLACCFACSTSNHTEPSADVNQAVRPSTTYVAPETRPQLNGNESAAVASDEALYQDLRNQHWRRIFPNGGRNVGGPQFFKYIFENLATSHDLFKRYSRFYCGVSGSVVPPGGEGRYDVVKVKDVNGRCILGKYYRCCWPCSCDVMKNARVEQVTVQLPNDPEGAVENYWVLTMGDPCHNCNTSPCGDLPPEVSAYQCKDGVTANGLRAKDGRLTSGTEGRLVFALLHDAAPADESDYVVSDSLMTQCQDRIEATPEQLERMNGMGDIFVSLSLVNSEESFTHSTADLCQ